MTKYNTRNNDKNSVIFGNAFEIFQEYTLAISAGYETDNFKYYDKFILFVDYENKIVKIGEISNKDFTKHCFSDTILNKKGGE